MSKKIPHIRHFFIPTPENGHTPLVLTVSAFFFFAVLGAALTVSPLLRSVAPFASLIPLPAPFDVEKVITLINQNRETVGLSRLTANDLLGRAAGEKAEDMLARQYFSHRTPDGKEPWLFLQNVSYRYKAAGENLALDFDGAETAHAALMRSPGHRANILNALYTEVGIAARSGTFDGRQSFIVVEFFGTPAARASEEIEIPKKLTAVVAPSIQKKPVQSQAELPAAPALAAPAKSMPLTRVLPAASQEETYSSPVGTRGPVSFSEPIRVYAFFAVLILSVLSISLLFLLIRNRVPHTALLARTLLLLIIFGGLVFTSISPKQYAKISEPSASTILSQ